MTAHARGVSFLSMILKTNYEQIMVGGHYLKKEGIIANRLEPEQVAGREEPHGTNRQRRRAVLGSVGSLSTA